MTKQTPRPAYHRRNDLKRLQELALLLPMVVSDEAGQYVVRSMHSAVILVRGRYEVVWAYLHGGIDTLKLVMEKAKHGD